MLSVPDISPSAKFSHFGDISIFFPAFPVCLGKQEREIVPKVFDKKRPFLQQFYVSLLFLSGTSVTTDDGLQ